MRVLAVLLLLALISACSVPAIADDASSVGSSQWHTVYVGVADTDNGNAGDDVGTTEEFEKDYLQAVAEYAHWNLVYVNAEWSDCLQMLAEGKIDVLTDVSKTDERLSLYNFSSEAMGTEMCYLYGRGDTPLKYDDFTSFNGMTVGYEEGSTVIDAFQTYAQKEGFSIKAVGYPNGTAMFVALDAGEVDGVVQTNFYDTPVGHIILAKCSPSPVYIATSKSNPALVKELDEAMAKLFSYNSHFNTDIYDYHFTSNEAVNVGYTQEELAYLATNPVVKVYYETTWEPFEYEQDGHAAGITPDVIRAIGQDTGITFDFVLASSTQDVYESADGTPCDALMAVSYDYSWAAKHNLLVTQPYATGSVMRVTKSSDIEPHTVAVVQGGYLGNQVSLKHPELVQKNYATFGDCLEAVEKNEADCVFVNYYQASNYRAMAAYEDFFYQPDDQISQSIALGVTRGSNSQLFGVVSKSLQHLSAGELQSILNEDSVQTQPLTFKTLMKRYPAQTVGISGLVCAVIALLIAMAVTSSARRRRNLQLVAAKQEAEAANRAKTDFLSRMSHDIRTPLNGIIGMTYLTEQMDLPKEAHDNLEKIDSSSKFLLSLINDVLDMSKVENDKIEFHPEPYPIDEFNSYLDSVLQPLCAEKGQHLVIDESGIVADQVPLADKLRVNQVLFNILSNASKYTPEGGTITYRICGEELGAHRCAISHMISDTGIGMSEDFQKRLFQPFTQEDRDDISSERGTGLGLAIVKRLVDAMGGTISVESAIGKGSTFTVRLEFDTVPAGEVASEKGAAEDARAAGSLRGRHILLCEDHPLNQEIAKTLLTQQGALVEVAEDGQMGVEAFRTSSAGYFDCVLMDIRMPVMDGYEATRAIRALDRADAKTVPIIAMTADAFADDVRRCLEVGMNAHVAKPFEPEALYRAIEDAIARNGIVEKGGRR